VTLAPGTAADDRRIEQTVLDWLEDYFGDDRARRRPEASLVRELKMDGDDAPGMIVDLEGELAIDLPGDAWERVDSARDVAAAFRAHRGEAAGVRRPAWYPERLFPYESRQVEAEGCLVHYVDEGDGPPLLLLHGNPTWSFLYRAVIGGLRDRFRCVAPDYPGFGLSLPRAGYDFRPASHAAVVERFALDLDLRDITLMVQDWGGPIGLALAARHPERFRALVIGNSWAWPVNGDPHFERFSALVGGPVGGLAIGWFNAFVNWLIPAGVRRRRLPREVMEAYRGPFRLRARRRPTHVFPREIVKSRDFLAGVEAGLARLAHLPALIVWGDRDIAFRAAERERFEASFPEHRTVILEGAGHYIQEDAPEEIVRAIGAWCEGAVGAR
jgi:haloalkane dehalogenase